MKKLIAVLAVILMFGCRKELAVPATVADTSAPARADVQLAKSTAPAPAEGAATPAPTPMIVRTASVRIVVDDTSKAVDAITKAVEASGGYVAGSQVWREGELLRARLTLRVPSASLTGALSAIRGLAKRVENETISSEDVTQEYVDLESRLRNLEATEVELRELMTVIRQNARKASEILEISQQMTAIRGDIEQTRGRMRYLGQVAAMSAVSLEVIPDAIAQPVVKPGWQPLVTVKNASRALITALQGIATALIWVVIYLLPIVGILLVVVTAIWKVYRRTRTREA